MRGSAMRYYHRAMPLPLPNIPVLRHTRHRWDKDLEIHPTPREFLNHIHSFWLGLFPKAGLYSTSWSRSRDSSYLADGHLHFSSSIHVALSSTVAKSGY